MKHKLNCPAWHVHSEKDFAPVSRVLGEYSIPHEVSREASLVPFHAAIMVSGRHLPKAIDVIRRNFGRRSGVDLE